MSLFVTLLQILLIALKLMSVITWSWFVVLLPIIILSCLWALIFTAPLILVWLNRRK